MFVIFFFLPNFHNHHELLMFYAVICVIVLTFEEEILPLFQMVQLSTIEFMYWLKL